MDALGSTCSTPDARPHLDDRGTGRTRLRDRMALAHDADCFIDYLGADHDAARAAIMPNWHYTHISDDVLPALREAGVTEAQIGQMLVGNPRRYFSKDAP
jgi:phosphotriesterase-related protein